MISGGEWKGYRGRVVGGDDKTLTIEITSKYRRIPIDRNLIEVNNRNEKQTGGESAHGG